MLKHINARAKELPAPMRQTLIQARRKLGWSQAELGRRVCLPQMHISGIETGKVVPRYDTLLDLVRVLDYDLVLVPRTMMPLVQALTQDQRIVQTGGQLEDEEQPMYTPDDEDEQEEPSP